MARKPAAKQKPGAGARKALAAQGKDAEQAPKKTGFGKRSMRAGAARSTSPSKSARPKSGPKPRKSVIGRAVGAVGSTLSGIAESATSVFRRRSPKTH